jgi:NAD(P)-dependent dehydrogenase (short-subunit alcohol dehydrogenase family)
MAESKSVLITGAGSGLGKLTALALLARRASVFACLRDPEGRDATAAVELRAAARGSSARLEVLTLDVRSDASVEAAAGALRALTDHLDVAINNAGLSAMGVNEAFTAAQARDLLEITRSAPIGSTAPSCPRWSRGARDCSCTCPPVSRGCRRRASACTRRARRRSRRSRSRIGTSSHRSASTR